MSGIFPNYILREFDNDGRLLSGGYLYFYESGTLTPKTVYSDFTLTTPLTNPVQLDAGGAADIWLGDGAYRILITSRNGVQIRSPIDGIKGVGDGLMSAATNISAAFVKTYNDVRTLTEQLDVIYVSGSVVEGDGGAGTFQRIPGSNLVDDDGIVLTSNSGADVYKRVFSGFINPEWYGVRYGVNTDNSLALQHALTASVVFNIPVRCTGSIYLTQNIVVPAYALLEATIDGFFHSGSTLSFVFTTGSSFKSVGVCFGNNIDPVFQSGVVDVIRLSWMGGFIPNDAFRKLTTSYASNSPGCQRLVVDSQLQLSSDFITGANTVLEFERGAYLDVQSQITINVPNVDIKGTSKVVDYHTTSNISTLVFGTKPVVLEWFGALGDGIDDTVAVLAGTRHGAIYGRPGMVYKATDSITCQDLSLEPLSPLSGASKPSFVFSAGLVQGSGRVLTTKGVGFSTNAGTLQTIVGTETDFVIGGTALNGNIELDSCVFEISSACTMDAQHACVGNETVFRYSHLLPGTMQWILDSCVVDATSTSMPIARADNTEFNTSVVLNKLSIYATVILRTCVFKHDNWKPFITATTTTAVDVDACIFTNTAVYPHAWANAKTWKYPVADKYITARYIGCSQNGKPVWDPYAISIDNKLVTLVGNSNAVAVPFASWGGLPAGLSASGNNLYSNMAIDATQTPNDGVGYVITPTIDDHVTQYPNIKASFSNAMGYAIAEIELVSSNSDDYVDLATSTAPICVVAPGINFFPGMSSSTVIVRSYDVKHAARCVAGNKIRLPVWIGVENSVTYVDSDGTYPTSTERDTTHKLQLQLVKVKTSIGATITVTVREAVVDDLQVFKALYNEPNKVFDSNTYSIFSQKRCVESYSYLGIDYSSGTKQVLKVEGNDLTVSVAGGYEINSVGTGAPDLNLWRCQFVTGTTFYNYWDLEISSPFPMLKHVDSFGQTFSLSKITMAKSGTSVPSASAIAHMNLISF